MNEQFWSPVKLSIEVASLSLLIVFVLGIGIARLTANRRFKGQSLMDTVLLLPLVLPPSVVGFLLIIIFGRQSPIGQGIEWVFHQPIMFTWWAAVIAATVVAFPLMYQSAKSGFETIDREIEDASRVDGANERQVFLLVTVPLASRAIVTGAILSFARALGEFGATLMFAGNIPGRTQTIPTAIYIAMDAGNMELAWLWVLTILVISFTMLFVLNVFKKQG
ncbi:molybdate ABC transporter permease subunit [Halalkalibacterium halodurans]|uniref:molybdate ABC transporter permease subunit n=1 Tax=Halalkalibacterium halodurans TaxID=86665 RepID=UPI002E1DA18F|nr:molybdate ABC transporter permease subunit [Halalkalibacterium halodurans]MED4083101.1 molybdate ABC transporter permease subunit [Halalkalibacterium halodurans]MED4086997.1 molybdate ABC transporter permease subunit [Halalkalibacterium halodurans]MED4106663.1 molybdate ABC transporter permease subunit [Halalkalibacterium halodurans]MED4110975.1 molybdate ABC transporter permease subunit [Halalkalibacterium halodurans]MED4125653.1 molybdate ABC transporter permease subunit [Halalkalibacteri